jgi:hypothetical protein
MAAGILPAAAGGRRVPDPVRAVLVVMSGVLLQDHPDRSRIRNLNWPTRSSKSISRFLACYTVHAASWRDHAEDTDVTSAHLDQKKP